MPVFNLPFNRVFARFNNRKQEDVMYYSVDTFRIKTMAALVMATTITVLLGFSLLIG